MRGAVLNSISNEYSHLSRADSRPLGLGRSGSKSLTPSGSARRLQPVKAPHLTVSQRFTPAASAFPSPGTSPTPPALRCPAVLRPPSLCTRLRPQSALQLPSPCSCRVASARSAPSLTRPAPDARAQTRAAPAAARRQRQGTSGTAPPLRRPRVLPCSSPSLPQAACRPPSSASKEPSTRYTRTSCSSTHTRMDTAASP